VHAFVPAPLPPVPPLAFAGDLQRGLEPAVLVVPCRAAGSRPAVA